MSNLGPPGSFETTTTWVTCRTEGCAANGLPIQLTQVDGEPTLAVLRCGTCQQHNWESIDPPQEPEIQPSPLLIGEEVPLNELPEGAAEEGQHFVEATFEGRTYGLRLWSLKKPR